MKNYLPILLLSLLELTGLVAQNNIIKSIPVNLHLGQGGGVDYGYEIREQEDGYLILNYHQFWPVPIGKDWNGLVKVDFTGEVQWITDYFRVGNPNYGISASYQKMAFIKDTLYLSHNKRNADYDYPGLIAIDRFTGDTLWTKFFDFGIEYEEDKLFIEKDGLLYLILGNRFLHSDRIKLLCLNDQGALLWEKELQEGENRIRPGALVPSSKGGFWLGTSIWDSGNTYDSWALFIELDSMGNELGRIKMERQDRGEEYTVAKVWECENGDIIGVNIEYPTAGVTAWFPPQVHRIAPDGTIKWTHSFAEFDEHFIYNIRESQNGDIVGVGAGYLGENYVAGSIGLGGWIFRFSPAGELLYDRVIIDTLLSPGRGMAFADFIEKEDGSFVLTGMVQQRFDSGSSDYNILFMTLDEDGCFYPDCENNQLISQLNFVLDEEEEFKVFPNPFSDQLTVHLPKEIIEYEFVMEVYNMSGQLYFTKKMSQVSDQVDFLFPELPAGTYLLQVKNDKVSFSTSLVKL